MHLFKGSLMDQKIKKLTITDKLVEIGPEITSGQTGSYAYLEFERQGRILNVASEDHTRSRLAGMLGIENSQFYLLRTTNTHTKQATAVMAAFGEQFGPKYALNMEGHGAESAIAASKRIVRHSYIIQLLGLFFFIVGIPALLLFVGIPMIIGGIYTIFQAMKMRKAALLSIAVIREMMNIQRSIPDIKYL